MAQLVEHYGFRFPVAVDPSWRTLQRWWLERRPQSWTSVSFLIDRKGIVRFIHPGGSYSQEEVQTMETLLGELLKEGAS